MPAPHSLFCFNPVPSKSCHSHPLPLRLPATALRALQALPPLDELQKFNAASQSDEGGAGGAAGGDLAGLVQAEAAAAGGSGAAAQKFGKGDRVMVIDGGCPSCAKLWPCVHAAAGTAVHAYQPVGLWPPVLLGRSGGHDINQHSWALTCAVRYLAGTKPPPSPCSSPQAT